MYAKPCRGWQAGKCSQHREPRADAANGPSSQSHLHCYACYARRRAQNSNSSHEGLVSSTDAAAKFVCLPCNFVLTNTVFLVEAPYTLLWCAPSMFPPCWALHGGNMSRIWKWRSTGVCGGASTRRLSAPTVEHLLTEPLAATAHISAQIQDIDCTH